MMVYRSIAGLNHFQVTSGNRWWCVDLRNPDSPVVSDEFLALVDLDSTLGIRLLVAVYDCFPELRTNRSVL